jgi:nitrile hydratase
VRALETILTEKGYVDPSALDAIIEGLRDEDRPAQRRARRRPGLARCRFQARTAQGRHGAVGTLGHLGRIGDHLVAVENTERVHNMVVCTLCSCYPWEVLGLPPVWYKAAPYRSRAVKDPRGVLKDFGVTLPESTEIRRLGLDRRNPLSGSARAPRGHREPERGRARGARHPQFHDRRRLRERLDEIA